MVSFRLAAPGRLLLIKGLAREDANLARDKTQAKVVNILRERA